MMGSLGLPAAAGSITMITCRIDDLVLRKVNWSETVHAVFWFQRTQRIEITGGGCA